MPERPALPASLSIFERGWLSSNNILIRGRDASALIDSGYCTHAGQTVALVETALAGQPLDRLANTHLHSDHCGGNAALQGKYPDLTTLIPPGQAHHVGAWDAQALSYAPTGQRCPQFQFNALLQPGCEVVLGDLTWQVHAAPGHDPHSVILFEPAARVLVSADALWENGFGVVFPELEGLDAFDKVGQTIDLIESLSARIVIPGHGPAFSEVVAAIASARKRLAYFEAHPDKHIEYAAKVLLKFKLLEVQEIELPALVEWARATPHFYFIHSRHFEGIEFSQWVAQLSAELVRSGAASRQGLLIRNA